MAALQRTWCPVCKREDVPLTSGGKLREHKACSRDAKVCRASGFATTDPRLRDVVDEVRCSSELTAYDLAAAWSELEIAGVSRESVGSIADGIRVLASRSHDYERRIAAARDYLASPATGLH